MSKANAPQGAAADKPGNNAGEWAKTVAEGVPGEAGTPPPPAPVGNITPEEVLDTDGGSPRAADSGQQEADNHEPMSEQTDNPETDPVTAADEADTATPADQDTDAEVIDAELVDDEADGELTNNPGANPGDNPESEDAAAEAIDGAFDDMSVEDLVLDLERVTTERDQYLDASRRLQAEFENYKKQVGKREATARERANDSLISELLPVLDAFDGALANGAEDVAPMRTSFLDALGKQGLERVDPTEQPFDPNLHEAVMHEDASDVDGPVVAEVMRAGYVWKGRVLRPAMVRTRG